MAFTVNLFVHGVPDGRKLWGKYTKEDSLYLDQFYTGNMSKVAKEYMKVECRSVAGVLSVFYTFVMSQNVNDSNGRQGSYFALTLKMNSYYSDIQNIYAILKTACHKYCIGQLLTVRQHFIQYAVSDFQSKDIGLKELEQAICKYIMTFSEESDIRPMGQQMSGKGEPKSISLSDCDTQTALNHIQSAGSVIVSEYFPSGKEQEKEEIRISELKEIEGRHEEEINRLKKESQQVLANLSHQLEEEKACNAQREEYRLRQLTQQLSAVNEKLEKAQKAYHDCEKTIEANNREINTYRQKFRKCSEILGAIGNGAGVSSEKNPADNQATVLSLTSSPLPNPCVTDSPGRKRKNWKLLVNILLLLLLWCAVCFLGLTLKDVSKNVETIGNSVEKIITQQQELKDSLTVVRPQTKSSKKSDTDGKSQSH